MDGVGASALVHLKLWLHTSRALVYVFMGNEWLAPPSFPRTGALLGAARALTLVVITRWDMFMSRGLNIFSVGSVEMKEES